MTKELLLETIANGETSRVQFKADVTNAVSLAQEMVAFANSKGGQIIIGVHDKTGELTGLSFQDIQRINSLLSTAAQEHVKSPIVITSDTVNVDGNRVIVVTVPEGTDKPHTDNSGIVWLKNGADKRKVVSREELARLLQSSGNLYAEEMPIQHSSLADFNTDKFKAFFEAKYKESFEPEELEKHIENLRLGANGKLNVAGALLFGNNVARLLPSYFITAVSFWGNNLAEDDYKSSENIYGTLDYLFTRAFDFVHAKLDKLQGDQSFNSLGKSEIPEVVLTEILVNALIHRDYFINDSIKLFVFQNRVEVISPGKLPNSLTEQQIKRGVRRTRNSLIASLAPDLMQYRGAGSGILRALQAYPNIDFFNDIEADQFKVTIHRPEKVRKPRSTT